MISAKQRHENGLRTYINDSQELSAHLRLPATSLISHPTLVYSNAVSYGMAKDL